MDSTLDENRIIVSLGTNANICINIKREAGDIVTLESNDVTFCNGLKSDASKQSVKVVEEKNGDGLVPIKIEELYLKVEEAVDRGTEVDVQECNKSEKKRRKSTRMRRNKCCYEKCSNSLLSNPDIHLFGFPRDEDRCRQWVLNSGNPDLLHLSAFDLFKKKQICSMHFAKTEYVSEIMRNRLNRNAIPIKYVEENTDRANVEVLAPLKTYSPAKKKNSPDNSSSLPVVPGSQADTPPKSSKPKTYFKAKSKMLAPPMKSKKLRRIQLSRRRLKNLSVLQLRKLVVFQQQKLRKQNKTIKILNHNLLMYRRELSLLSK